tara:strand:- start:98 stop:388 length:291 start_codon:yes stop_codon:yes gene_type:complete
MDINKNKNWIECAIEHYEDRCKRLDHKIWESKLLRHLKTYRSTAWKENRIQEINDMPFPANEDHPCFDEIHAIYESKATSYEEFLNDFRDGSTTTH